jgi:hypothetical protein
MARKKATWRSRLTFDDTSNRDVIAQTLTQMKNISAQISMYLMNEDYLKIPEEERNEDIAELRVALRQLEELNIQAQRIEVLQMSADNITHGGVEPRKVSDIMNHLKGLTPSKQTAQNTPQGSGIPDDEDLAKSLGG